MASDPAHPDIKRVDPTKSGPSVITELDLVPKRPSDSGSRPPSVACGTMVPWLLEELARAYRRIGAVAA